MHMTNVILNITYVIIAHKALDLSMKTGKCIDAEGEVRWKKEIKKTAVAGHISLDIGTPGFPKQREAEALNCFSLESCFASGKAMMCTGGAGSNTGLGLKRLESGRGSDGTK